MTVADNAVNVPEGTYLVTYTLNASSGFSTNLGIGLYLNDTLIASENVKVSAAAGELVSISKTAIITVDTASTLSIYNTSDADITIVNAGLSVVKLQ